MKRRIYTILSILITVGVMGYLFRIVSVRDVISTIKNMEVSPFLCFIILSFWGTFFRTWRYLLLLNVCGVKVPAITMFLVTIVRNFFSDLLPARIGTLSYVYILTNRLGVALERALSSFAIAFIFDIIVIIPLLLISLCSIGWETFGKFQLLVSGSLGILIILLVVLRYLPELFRITARICQRFPFLKRGRDGLDKTSLQIEEIKNSGVYHRVFILSVFVRLCKYAQLYFLLLALLSASGYGWKEIGFGRFFLGACGAEFSASLPVSGIAGFGAYEGTWAIIFTILGFPRKLAITTGISHHLITQVWGYSLGVICLAVLLLPLFKVRKLVFEKISPPSLFMVKLALSVAILCATISSVYLIKTLLVREPKEERDVPRNSRPAGVPVSDSARVVAGVIVYEYAGGIYCVKVGGREPICLAPDGSYPRWSPDGRFVAFRRGDRVMRISADGKHEECLAEGENVGAVAYHPNGREVLFVDGEQVKSVSLEDHKVRRLATGYRFAEIDISADGKRLICTVLKPIRILAFDLETEKKRMLVRGCSASLSPDGGLVTSLAGSHTKLHLRSWESGESVSVIDAPAGFRFDNQFWSNHPDWIASQVELEKKVPGDIYIHQVSKNRAIQVTFTAGCDRPDLFVQVKSQQSSGIWHPEFFF